MNLLNLLGESSEYSSVMYIHTYFDQWKSTSYFLTFLYRSEEHTSELQSLV